MDCPQCWSCSKEVHELLWFTVATVCPAAGDGRWLISGDYSSGTDRHRRRRRRSPQSRSEAAFCFSAFGPGFRTKLGTSISFSLSHYLVDSTRACLLSNFLFSFFHTHGRSFMELKNDLICLVPHPGGTRRLACH